MLNVMSNKIWHLFVAVAFLLMQSASAHIHIASSHNHDGHSHSHSQLVHAHSIASHHVDAFEPGHQNHASKVVELCQEWIVKYGKCFSDLESQAILGSLFSFCKRPSATESYFDNPFVYRSFHFLFKVQARAPPTILPLTFKS